jgi:hypothetical protein
MGDVVVLTVPGHQPNWRMNMKRHTSRSPAICEAVEPRRMLCSSHVSDYILAQDRMLETQRAATGVLESGPEASQFFDISWSNRGSLTNDSDNFNAVFGPTRAEIARNVVEAAIMAWEYAIVDIHGQGGRNWIGVDIYADPSTTGWGGGELTKAVDDFGIPIRGNITFNAGNATATPDRGWYLDATPSDHSEFMGSITNAFAGRAVAGAASGLFDLYTVVVSELAHLVGVGNGPTSSDETRWETWNGYANSNVPDNNEGGGVGKLWYLYNPQFQQLMTSNNGGPGGSDVGFPVHTSPGNLFVAGDGMTYAGSQDAGNSRYAVSERYLVPNNLAMMLQQVYGYEIRMPEGNQSFYTLLQAGGVLHITGGSGNSNDIINVYPNGSNIEVSIDIGNDVAGTGPTDAFFSTWTASSVNSILIDAGDGSDTINVFATGKPVTVNGGAGTNVLTVAGGTGADSVAATLASVTVNGIATSFNSIQNLTIAGGAGGDTFSVNQVPLIPYIFSGGDNNDTFNISFLNSNVAVRGDNGSDVFQVNVGGAAGGVLVGGDNGDTFNVGANSVPFTVYGGIGNDVVNVSRCGAPFTVNCELGDDTVNVGTLNATSSIAGAVTINGDFGLDTVNVAPSAPQSGGVVVAPVTFNAGGDSDTLNIGSGTLDAIDANVTSDAEIIHLFDHVDDDDVDYVITGNTLTRSSIFNGLSFTAATQRIILDATGGANRITIGNAVGPFLELYAGTGNDNFVLGGGIVGTQGAGRILEGWLGNDAITFDDHLNGNSTTWGVNLNQVAYIGGGGAGLLSTVGFETVAILGGGGHNTFNMLGNMDGQSVSLRGGVGNDTFNDNGARTESITVNGGLGTDTLKVDDTILQANYDTAVLHPEWLRRIRPASQVEPERNYYVHYDDVETLDIYLPDAQNYVEVQGTSPDIPLTSRTMLHGGAVNNAYDVYPRDAAGNSTLPSSLIIAGSVTPNADWLVVDGLGSTLPMAYTVSSYTPTAGTRIQGLGAGDIVATSTIDTLEMHGGGGNDTFSINSQYMGMKLKVFGSGGNDTVNLGSNAVVDNIADGFHFDGQTGTDTLNVNAVLLLPFTITRTAGALTVFGENEFYYYDATFTDTSVELTRINSGGRADAFYVAAVPTGSQLAINAGGGGDTLQIGAGVAHLDQIRGPITFDGSSGGGSIVVSDDLDPTGDIAHLTASTLGAYAGDSLFGPGGSLQFTGLTNGTASPGIALNLGSGADTIYAQPLTAARVTINANSPTSGAGDKLNLALAGVQSPVVSGTGTGSVTSANRQTLNWTGIDQAISTDSVAPAMISSLLNLNGVPIGGGASRQAVEARFSENVSASLSPASLQLTNLTTGQLIPTTNIALAYIAATNTARFTFPGYSNGVLPDGDYSGFFNDVADFFGNDDGIAVPKVEFFVLGGDANHDRKVDITDLGIVASNWQGTSKLFSQGDMNYDGKVDIADLGILSSRWQQALALPTTSQPATTMSASKTRPGTRLVDEVF